MAIEFFLAAVAILMALAVFDLVVGVSNDAANFLNSSIGSRVAPRSVIVAVASLGILAGVTFSSGMMEVARKGIFHPQLFTMPELITVFLAVMLTDIILLDLYNTFGLPTSTTVSIVFELLGGAVAVSLIKISKAGASLGDLANYINTSKALAIILGILLSVVLSFVFGALIQFLTRLAFTFDYRQRIRRIGAIWTGIAMASITYFILVKGAKGVSFISAESADWIRSNKWALMGAIFVASAVIFQGLVLKGVNILKPVILIGTFALALAFAANDLVNFIGVPLAGLHAYQAAVATSTPLTTTMDALAGKVRPDTWMLLVAGGVMVVTLWRSKKARTVSDTEVNLGRQDEGVERFESTFVSRALVRTGIGLGGALSALMPRRLREFIDSRMDTTNRAGSQDDPTRPSFDLLRASVNLMVASGVISYATSYKLPLSTTYVTFMVAMGTSFADMAWGRESAVYRITGVLTVMGGWFTTAFLASTIAATFASILYFGGVYGAVFLIGLAITVTWRTHHKHRERWEAKKEEQIFNLKKIQDPGEAVAVTFGQMSLLLREIRQSLDLGLVALFNNDIVGLDSGRRKTKAIQRWANIISANVFKAMRLLSESDNDHSFQYSQTVRRLQKLTDGHRDMVNRGHQHTANHHAGLLPDQVAELEEVRERLGTILREAEVHLTQNVPGDLSRLNALDDQLRKRASELTRAQAARVHSFESKTRLSILYYAILGNAAMISKQTLRLVEIFNDTLGPATGDGPVDLE